MWFLNVKNNHDIAFSIQGEKGCLLFVRGVIDSLRVSRDLKRKMSMAVIEAVDNAIFHGNGGRRGEPVGIKIIKNGTKVTVEVKDNGKGFDIDKVRIPELISTNGRGILIIKSVTNEVKYKKGTLTMVFKE